MMANTIYILGAGCSRNYSFEYENPIPGLKSPLDNDFFEMAYKVLTNEPADKNPAKSL